MYNSRAYFSKIIFLLYNYYIIEYNIYSDEKKKSSIITIKLFYKNYYDNRLILLCRKRL